MTEIKTPVKSIRAKCLDCCAGSAHEVRLCTATECPLYHYRMRHRPKRPPTEADEVQSR